ncbi:hypothetical protein ACOMHN_061332 [Nucella lapillus]
MEVCAQCGQRGSADIIRQCSGCKTARYCSRPCQKQHWARHKTVCRRAQNKSVHGKDSNQRSAQEGETTTMMAEEKHTGGDLGATGGEAATAVGEAVTGEGAEGGGGVLASSPEGGSSVDGPVTTCHKCGIQRYRMKVCKSCQKVTYCSRDCQRADWKTHQMNCQPSAKTVVIGTDDKPHTQQAKGPVKRAQGVAAPSPMDLLSLFLRGMTLTPPITWEEARSRAEKRYPQHRIVDKFGDLRSDWMGGVRKEGVVAVVKIGTQYPHFFRHGRCLEDVEGMTSFVLFHTDDPWPHFHYDQLCEGNFLCYQHAHLHIFMDGTVGFRIDEAREVHILEPSRQTSQESASTVNNPPPPPSSSSTHEHAATPQQWKDAKLKAQRMVPGAHVLDWLLDIDDRDLEMFANVLPISPPTWDKSEDLFWQNGQIRSSLLLLLQSRHSHSLRHSWLVRDKTGKSSQLNFELSASSPPHHFSFEDLRQGVFLCVSKPWVNIVRDCYTVCVKDASSVHIVHL